MQAFGVLSSIWWEYIWGKVIFGASLFFMMFPLGLALWEISLSAEALNIELSDMQK